LFRLKEVFSGSVQLPESFTYNNFKSQNVKVYRLKPKFMKALILTALLFASATLGYSQESKVIFIRADSPFGLTGSCSAIVNNEFKGKIKSFNHLEVDVNAGNLFFQVRWAGRKASERLETVIIPILPGQTHYLMIVDSFRSLELLELTEQAGQRILAKQGIRMKINESRMARATP